MLPMKDVLISNEQIWNSHVTVIMSRCISRIEVRFILWITDFIERTKGKRNTPHTYKLHYV